MEILTALRAQWDRAAAVGALALGLLILLLGYLGVSHTEYVAEQLPYIISGGIVGLFFIISGATLWLSADLRDEWRKLDSLDAKLEKAFGVLEGRAADAESAA
jgi:hypothetical protein